MSERTKTRLKIASSFAMCLVSLFAVVAATLSWFAMNDKTSGNGMNIKLEGDGILLGYECYSLEKQENGSYTLNLLAEPNLGTYDRLHANYHLIVKIYIDKNANDSINFTAHTETEDYLGSASNKLKKEGNPLSSVVAFGLLTQDDINEISDSVVADKKSVNMVQNNAIQKEVKIDSVSKNALTDGTYNNVDCLVAYMFVTYDPSLMNAVLLENVNNENIKGTEKIKFAGDFTVVISDGSTGEGTT